MLLPAPAAPRRSSAAGLVATFLATCLCVPVPGQQFDAEFRAPQPAEEKAEPLAETDRPPADASNGKTVDQDVRAASFRNVTPGQTTLAETLEILGEPQSRIERDGKLVLSYQVGPFPQVTVTVREDLVASIKLELPAPAAVADVIRDLKLERFERGPLTDDTGRIIGQVVPERAIRLAYDPATGERGKVTQITLEVVRGEPFLRRAQQSGMPRLERTLYDLDLAMQFAPQSAEVFWEAATLRETLGEYDTALQLAQQAQQRDSANRQFALTVARLQLATGAYQLAQSTLVQLANSEQNPAHVRAAATAALGRLALTETPPDYRQAVSHYRSAALLAGGLTDDPAPEIRCAAKRVLIECYVDTAEAIARGPWKRKPDVVPQWLASADKVLESLLDEEHQHPATELAVRKAMCRVHLAMGGRLDVGVLAGETLELGRELIGQADDAVLKRHLEWELGEALLEAAQVLQDRGAFQEAMTLAENAHTLLTAAAGPRPATAHREWVLGRAHFQLGVLYAIHKKDHEQAIRWYEQALPQLSKVVPATCRFDGVVCGERFVSIGVSYWEVGQAEKARELTERGAQKLEESVRDGMLPDAALIVAYGNLASIHSELGDREQAAAFEQKAARLEQSNTARQR